MSSMWPLPSTSKDVFTEGIPLQDTLGDMGPLGLDANAIDFLTLIRYAMPDNQQAGDTWWRTLPLTVLRVREPTSSQRQAEPFPPFVADQRTAAPEAIYAADLNNLIRQVCERWGQPCDPTAPPSDRLRRFVDLQLQLGDFGPLCRSVGMDCLGDGQDASYFFAPARPFGSGSAYAVVGTLGTVTGNATYVGLSMNDMSKLKGVLNVRDTELTGSAASYASTVNNTDKFFVHYFSRDCNAIASFTDGQCTTVTTDMVPPVGEGKQGMFATGLRSYVRPGTERGPLSSEQLKPVIIQFTQP